MSSEVLEKKIAGISPRYRGELDSFVDFLLFKQANEQKITVPAGDKPRKSLFGALKDKDFFMAPDFDAPLEEFAEYM